MLNHYKHVQYSNTKYSNLAALQHYIKNSHTIHTTANQIIALNMEISFSEGNETHIVQTVYAHD